MGDLKMIEACEQGLKESASPAEKSAGLHFWLRYPEGRDGERAGAILPARVRRRESPAHISRPASIR